MPLEILIKSTIAGVLASLACGLGVLPLWVKKLDYDRYAGLGYAVAGGLMFAASVYNLILPGLQLETHSLTWHEVAPVISGILLGALFMSMTDTYLSEERLEQKNWARFGTRGQILIFLAMAIHSIPEGVAVGVGYASETVYETHLGTYIAVAIGIHNIPEGLAVGIPLRSAGASLNRAFWMAVLTSVPQPVAAIPAGMASWFFQPLMPILMGFAAGAMIFLVLLEIIPAALKSETQPRIAWAFTIGFCLMILVQILI
ncbi:MAG TPA: ZIP family metal transporter [Bacteroidetes bacterium]|nr:ZIP family metal transporter [Bacteroidota bacterium]